jgi:hypothetical protein
MTVQVSRLLLQRKLQIMGHDMLYIRKTCVTCKIKKNKKT